MKLRIGLSSKLVSSTPDYGQPRSDLIWYYEATKQDSLFKTGETDGPVLLNGGSEGLPSGEFGSFSLGCWEFKFYAFTTDDCTQGDDGTYSADFDTATKYYDAVESTDYTILSSSSNIVSVSVQLVEAQYDYGYLLLSGIYWSDSEDENDEDATVVTPSTDDGMYAVISLYTDYDEDDGNVDVSGYEAAYTCMDTALAAFTSDGLLFSFDTTTTDDEGTETTVTSTQVPVGSYAVLVELYHPDYGLMSDSPAVKATVRSSLTTPVSGNLKENTANAELDEDVNVTYDTYEASTADELIAYLAIEGATVVLTSDLSVDETLEIATDTVLDLGSCSLESDVAVAEGVSLSITSSSDDASSLSGTIELSSGSSLTVDGVTLSSEETGSILISASEADVTVTITDATLVSSENGRLIDVLLTEDSDKDGTLSITISDTTAYIDAVSGGSDGASRGININGSADESDGSLSKLELVLSSVTIIDETESSSYSVYPLNICYVDEADITIEDTTIKCNTNHYATRFSAIGNADRTSTITITESTLQGYSAITAKYMTNVVMDITSSSLLGYNYNDGDDDDFCTIYLSYAIGTTINVDKSTVAFMEYGDATQALAGIEWILTSSYANNSINFTNCTLEWNNKPEEESDERAFYNLENWYSDFTLSDDKDYVVSGTLCSNNSVNLDEATQQSLGIYGDDSSYVTYMDYLWLIGGDADLAWTGQNNLLQLRTE